MPQKRNPYALSMIRGTTGVLIGHVAGMLAVQKSPSARSDNLIFAYGEIPAAVEHARRMTELTAGVVATLTMNEERLARGAAGRLQPGDRRGRAADAERGHRLPDGVRDRRRRGATTGDRRRQRRRPHAGVAQRGRRRSSSGRRTRSTPRRLPKWSTQRRSWRRGWPSEAPRPSRWRRCSPMSPPTWRRCAPPGAARLDAMDRAEQQLLAEARRLVAEERTGVVTGDPRAPGDGAGGEHRVAGRSPTPSPVRASTS